MNTLFKAAPQTPLPATSRSPLLLWIWLLVLVPGLALVGWRAMVGAETRRDQAAAQGQILASRLEQHVQNLVNTAETLGLAARRAGPAFADFQAWAGELQRTRPGWVVMEYQPGGVVRDVAPRTGFQRLLGVNVVSDPNQRPGFLAALQTRALTLSAPVRLPGNSNGVVARVPIVTRGADGRDQVTAFVSVSMKLEDLAQRAGFGRLAGYESLLFAAAPAGQKPQALLTAGRGPFRDAVQIPLRVANLDWRLAIRPVGGWGGSLRVVFESFLVLVLAGLTGWLVQERRHQAMSAESLREATRSLARAADEQKKAQDACRAATEKAASLQSELDKARAKLGDTEFMVADLHGKMDTHTRTADEARGTLQARVKEAESQVGELKARLDIAEGALEETKQTKDAELVLARLAGEKSLQAIADLEARLDQAGKKQKELVAMHQAESEAAQARSAELEKQLARLEKSRDREAEQAQEREASLSARITDLEAKLREPVPGVEPSETPEPGPAGPAALVEQAPHTGPVPGPAPMPSPPVAQASEPAVSQVSKPAARATAARPRAAEPEPEPVAPAAVAPDPAVEPAADTAPDGEDKTTPGKDAKRKRPRRDNQMDLFGGPAPEPEPASESESEPASATVSAPPVEPGTEESSAEEQPEETTEPESELPSMPGLNTAAGLAAAGNNPKAYLGLLRRFLEQDAGSTNAIRDALEAGDSEKAQEVTEELAARAAELGAEVVEPAARALGRGIHDQAHPDRIEFLWGDLDKAMHELAGELKSVLKPREERSAAVRRTRPGAPVDLGQLRKAAHEIVPLLADGDPGAKDCFKANKATFKSAFSSEGFDEFEDQVKRGRFGEAFESLKRTTKRHGISI